MFKVGDMVRWRGNDWHTNGDKTFWFCNKHGDERDIFVGDVGTVTKITSSTRSDGPHYFIDVYVWRAGDTGPEFEVSENCAWEKIT